ncbi:glycosyltransferase [Silvibacterium acidisoli]|uniref:glycosyltransferase n=1 Tax=Acidobacteriaceae bacterium ZG23-2 TaxID=2883246 RepID=UPI00406D3270
MSNDLVQCVIVLYRIALRDSLTFQTLSASFARSPSLASRLSILIYDNSPAPQNLEPATISFANVEYRHDAANGGLAAAYNAALAAAETAGCSWLWLFDQDTDVRPELASVLVQTIDAGPDPAVCAIVPKLIQDGRVLSPLTIQRFRYFPVAVDFAGVHTAGVIALNSGACLRVSSLLAIGGFPREYWLDYLDHAVFHRLKKAGGEVLVLDVLLTHQLSLMNLKTQTGHKRYENVLCAEWQFVRESGWGGGSSVHRLRLIKRAVRTLVVLRQPGFALQVLKWSLK